jgi:hypothetical protein
MSVMTAVHASVGGIQGFSGGGIQNLHGVAWNESSGRGFLAEIGRRIRGFSMLESRFDLQRRKM